MAGRKRKRPNQKITKGRKRMKMEEVNKDEHVKINTMPLNTCTSGAEDMEEDETLDLNFEQTSNDNDDYTDDSRAKADAANVQQHNTEIECLKDGGHHSQHRDSSSEEDEESALRTHAHNLAKAKYKNFTSEQSKSTHAHQNAGHNHRPNSDTLDITGREQTQIQKSPPLRRRPLSPATSQENYYVSHSSSMPLQLTSAPIVANSSKAIWRNVILLVCFGICSSISCGVIYKYPKSVPEPSNELSFIQVVEKFEDKLELFSSKFPNQNQDNWRKIRSAVKATTKFVSPQSPGVISLVSLAASEHVANCMGLALASKLQGAYNDSKIVLLRGKDYNGKDASNISMKIDGLVRQGLGNGAHVVLLEGLHLLPAESGLIFHGLCDNENAPFKQAIYIFTSVIDKIVDEVNQQEVTTFWKDTMSEDKRYSLESRIGNNIIIVKPEKNDSAYKDCV